MELTLFLLALLRERYIFDHLLFLLYKPGIAVICFLCPDCHRQSADNDQNQPGKRLSAQLFFEYEIGKSDGNDNAELIDRYDNADDAVLYGVIVTEP